MTDPTNHPQGAEEIWKKQIRSEGYNERDYEKYFKSAKNVSARAMHTHTEDWLKYFAERVKAEIPGTWVAHRASVDILLSEVTAKMRNPKGNN